jgi:hypothetical protein
MEEDLEIKVLEHDAVIGAIPITWCISKEKMATLEHHIDRCRVLIITAPLEPGQLGSSKSEWRTVVPLKDMMAYVTFLRPGKSRIFVLLVDPRDFDRGDIDWWLSKKGRVYHSDLLSYHAQEVGERLSIHRHHSLNNESLAKAELDIEMPVECFAKLPPKWVRNWANMMFDAPAVDQCQFRKRLIFAFTVQPIILLVIGAVVGGGTWLHRLLLALGCTLVACKGVNWKPVLHPFTDSLDTVDVYRNIRGSYLYFPKLPYTMSWGPAAVIPTLLVFGLVVYLFAIDLRLGISIIVITLFGLSLLVAISVLFPLWVMFIDWVLFDLLRLVWINDHWLFRWMDWKGDREKERMAWKEERKRMEAALLLCHQAKFTRMQDLPRKKRTFKLHFKATKAKICRPFPV